MESRRIEAFMVWADEGIHLSIHFRAGDPANMEAEQGMISENPENGAPTTSPDEVNALETLLRMGAGWMSASAILISRYQQPTETNKRILRATAAESKWIISGFHGYKHLQQATPEEVKHFVNQMESQARNMSERAQAIHQNYRKVFQAV